MERDPCREVREHQCPTVKACRQIVKEVNGVVTESDGDKGRAEACEKCQPSGQIGVRHQRRDSTSVKLNHDAARLIALTLGIVDDQPEIRDGPADMLAVPDLEASTHIQRVEHHAGAVRV